MRSFILQSVSKIRIPGQKAESRLLLLMVMLIFVLFTDQARADEFDPVAIYLTWQYDPSSSMTIDWHTTPSDGYRHFNRISELHVKADGEYKWRETTGNSHDFPHSDRLIHRVQLRHLEPGTTYHFRFGKDSKTYKFKTMPDKLTEPFRFAAGGDTEYDEEFIRMNRVVMEYEPEFILWGGDLPYANGEPARVNLWYEWFDGIKKSLINDDGRVIPIVVTIGNHELFGERRLFRPSAFYSGSEPLTEEEAEAYMVKHNLWDGKPTFFFDLLAFPGRPSYNVLDFGDYMSLFALDTDHYSSVEGGQTGWLESMLAERQDRTHLLPVYHVPAYPSHRAYSGHTSTRVREHWVPLFEKYGVRVALENHDHTYKRTYPLRNGEIVDDGEGIVYIGDGAWGVEPRDCGDSCDEWYIQKFASKNHGIIVTLDGDTQDYLMVDIDGEVIDSYTSRP